MVTTVAKSSVKESELAKRPFLWRRNGMQGNHDGDDHRTSKQADEAAR
jgi:hypothetical protein